MIINPHKCLLLHKDFECLYMYSLSLGYWGFLIYGVRNLNTNGRNMMWAYNFLMQRGVNNNRLIKWYITMELMLISLDKGRMRENLWK